MNGINRNDTPENIILIKKQSSGGRPVIFFDKNNCPPSGRLLFVTEMVVRLPDSYFFLQK